MADHFIGEYRLFGTVCPDGETTLVLWDTSNTRTPRDPPRLVFEPGPDWVYSSADQNIRSREVNHLLPFRESPSMGIARIVIYAKNPITRLMDRRVLIVPVRTLVSFAHRIGPVTHVPWQDWLHFATLTPVSSSPHVLHSQLLSVLGAEDSLGSTSILRVMDFSLRSRRREVQDDPSAPLPLFTVREFPFDADYYYYKFDFTEGGVLTTPARTHVIARQPKILT